MISHRIISRKTERRSYLSRSNVQRVGRYVHTEWHGALKTAVQCLFIQPLWRTFALDMVSVNEACHGACYLPYVGCVPIPDESGGQILTQGDRSLYLCCRFRISLKFNVLVKW